MAGPHVRPVLAKDNARLLAKIREHHAASDGVMGAPRMHEVLGYEGETANLNRIARLMADADLSGVPQKRRWRHKRTGVRPAHFRNHLAGDFAALKPNTNWWRTSPTSAPAKAGYTCAPCWICTPARSSAGAGSALGAEGGDDGELAAVGSQLGDPALRPRYAAHQCRVPAVPEGPPHHQQHERRRSLWDNAEAEGFFGKLKREPVRRPRYLTLAEARSDLFDYIERFHDPLIQRRLDPKDQAFRLLTQQSVETG